FAAAGAPQATFYSQLMKDASQAGCQAAGLSRAWYEAPVAEFRRHEPDFIIGRLTRNNCPLERVGLGEQALWMPAISGNGL
ncbi:MAG TPA: hypothetical protein PK942_07505, partial [Verrucomicrobiota bacterium]|nr:hypothetical protein [Verrucomicrobiota bacterium]